MRILAIIPARAGSKGIPNKNIRIIGGHPMVFYSIHTAMQSDMITDVIVSTDSPEVRIIAERMGAIPKWRDAVLCEDSVTLDAVIYDAIPTDTVWDYVVTMQPTSPTLKTSTLDAAIKFCIEHDLDTLISAVNRPHLAWIEDNDKKRPAYQKRLNRQFLPPYYIETGAFFVSKGSCVTPDSRFGTKVDVFEVSEEEAVDIDSFEDLRYAETIFKRQKAAIYVNGNNKRGIGHIYRALELADEFFCKPDIYYDINQTKREAFGSTTHRLIPVNGIGDLLLALEREQYNIFINDVLATSIDYMIALRKAIPNSKIINFEDDGEGIYKADLVFNSLYQEESLPQVKAGERYYIPQKLFLFYEPIRIKPHVESVFISFGGADPKNYSDRLLAIISDSEYKKYSFTVVLGRAKHNVEELFSYNKYKNISVYYDVKNMPELMSSCDVGITSRGRTSYELAMLGIPTFAMAQNKREEKHGFVCNENGFTYIGLDPSDAIIKATLDMYLNMSLADRSKYQDSLLKHDLRNGRKRVMNLINNL